MYCGVGNYRFYRSLSSGAQGEVYQAKNTEDQEEYAVKVFKDVSDLETEIMGLSDLRHQNIVKVYYASHSEMCRLKTFSGIRPYLVLELAKGGALYNFIATGAFPEKLARRYFHHLISGLSYMHS